MFCTKSDRMFPENAEGPDDTRVSLHNIDNTGGRRSLQPEEASSYGCDIDNNGTWGERDIGGQVNLRGAMTEYEEMRRELTALSKTRTSKSNRSNATREKSWLRRLSTAGSDRSRVGSNARNEPELELGTPDGTDDFELDEFLKDAHFEKRQAGKSAKKVCVVYKNLTVKGVGATTTFVKTLPSAIVGVRSLDSPRTDLSNFHCERNIYEEINADHLADFWSRSLQFTF
jgi:ATP-binding cassette, subfamily G (WHITE), member 2, SNQ2